MYMMLDGFWLGQKYINYNGVNRNECYIFTPDKSLYLGGFLIPINMPFRPDNLQLSNLINDYGQLIGTIPVKPTRNSKIKK